MPGVDDDNQAKRRLVDARFKLAAIVESSNDAIIGKDLNGVITSWNNAAEAMFGYAADEILGQPIICIIPEHRIDEEMSILNRIRRGEKITHLETERRCKDGTIIPVMLTISPILRCRQMTVPPAVLSLIHCAMVATVPFERAWR
jgi:PAS domain S-box-containing protein